MTLFSYRNFIEERVFNELNLQSTGHTPKRDIRKLSQCTLELSIVCKTAICREEFDTSFSHGLDQCHQSLLRDGIPLLLQELEQLSEVCYWEMIVMNTVAEDVPEVLDGCQIQGMGGQSI